MLRKTWENSYPVLLRKNGYRTAFAGKFGFDLREEPNGKRLPMPENDFDMWGGGPGQTNYSTAKNASMKHYAKDYPHSTRSYGAFGRDFSSNLRRQTNLFVYQSVLKHRTNLLLLILWMIIFIKIKNLKSLKITDGNLVSTFRSKANRTGNTNDFTPGIIQTNTMRSWQPTINRSMPSMLRWE